MDGSSVPVDGAVSKQAVGREVVGYELRLGNGSSRFESWIVHRDRDCTYRVVSGRVVLEADGRLELLRTGDQHLVERGNSHRLRTIGRELAVVSAHGLDEASAWALRTLTDSGMCRPDGLPRSLAHRAGLARASDTYPAQPIPYAATVLAGVLPAAQRWRSWSDAVATFDRQVPGADLKIGFQYPVDPGELIAERAIQFAGWGIPHRLIDEVHSGVTDMWGDGPTGWTPRWAAAADRAESRGKWLLAALCWGAARFPTVSTAERADAYRRQLRAFLRAAVRFPVYFDRTSLTDTDGVLIGQAHVYRRSRAPQRDLIVVSGGVDTWKVELHRLGYGIARATGAVVAVIDHPGTGESRILLRPNADAALSQVCGQLRQRYRARSVGFLGVSFGGHWAAKLALLGVVDAAIDLGGPVHFRTAVTDPGRVPGGMAGIIAHAYGLDSLPASDTAAELIGRLDLDRQGVLDLPLRVPLLAINGTRDPYLPIDETAVFAQRADSTVWLVRDAGHCAAEKLPVVMPAAVAWLQNSLRPSLFRATAARLLGSRVTPLLAGFGVEGAADANTVALPLSGRESGHH